MKRLILFVPILFLLISCSTLSKKDSTRIGAIIGVADIVTDIIVDEPEDK
jgi:hypothetical protein